MHLVSLIRDFRKSAVAPDRAADAVFQTEVGDIVVPAHRRIVVTVRNRAVFAEVQRTLVRFDEFRRRCEDFAEVFLIDHTAAFHLCGKLSAVIFQMIVRCEGIGDRLGILHMIRNPRCPLMREDERLVHVERVDDVRVVRHIEIFQFPDGIPLVPADDHLPVGRDRVNCRRSFLPERIPRVGIVPDQLIQQFKPEVFALVRITVREILPDIDIARLALDVREQVVLFAVAEEEAGA